jgi:CHASE2 domain-containing sensor protein
LHARLVRKLTKDGARLVVFDVLFDKATDPKADDDFADAIRGHRKVALAATREAVVRPGLSGFEPVFPIAKLRDAAAGVGMVNLVKDSDGAVRRPFLESDQHSSLPRVAATLAGAAALPEINPARPRWLRYYGPTPRVFPAISYEDALEQLDGYFRDQFVFVGSTLHIKRPGESSDFFRTPFTRWGGAETPGVALVATGFLNLIRGDALRRSPALLEVLAILGMAWAVAWVCSSVRLWSATGLAALLGLFAAGAGFLLQSAGQVLFPWMIPAVVVTPCAWAWSMVVAFKTRGTLLRSQAAKPGARSPVLRKPAPPWPRASPTTRCCARWARAPTAKSGWRATRWACGTR